MEEFKIGDKVKLNDLYFKEGRKYFGRNLRYINNFVKTVVKIYPPLLCNNDAGVVVLEDDISICTTFLEKVKE